MQQISTSLSQVQHLHCIFHHIHIPPTPLRMFQHHAPSSRVPTVNTTFFLHTHHTTSTTCPTSLAHHMPHPIQPEPCLPMSGAHGGWQRRRGLREGGKPAAEQREAEEQEAELERVGRGHRGQEGSTGPRARRVQRVSKQHPLESCWRCFQLSLFIYLIFIA